MKSPLACGSAGPPGPRFAGHLSRFNERVLRFPPATLSHGPIFPQKRYAYGRLLLELLPEPASPAGKPEVQGLLALMLLHEARRSARATPEGDLVLLEDQDRSLWNPNQIKEGVRRLVEQALQSGRFGPYTLHAAIAALHAEAATPEATDWDGDCRAL